MIQSLIEPLDIINLLDAAGADMLDTGVEDVARGNKDYMDQCQH